MIEGDDFHRTCLLDSGVQSASAPKSHPFQTPGDGFDTTVPTLAQYDKKAARRSHHGCELSVLGRHSYPTLVTLDLTFGNLQRPLDFRRMCDTYHRVGPFSLKSTQSVLIFLLLRRHTSNLPVPHENLLEGEDCTVTSSNESWLVESLDAVLGPMVRSQ